MKRILLLAFAVLFSQSAFTKEIELIDPEVREEYIRRADVWLAPEWISEDFKFADDLDVYNGPEAKGFQKLFMNSDVYCKNTSEHVANPGNGKTPKFFCDLLERDAQGALVPVTSGKKNKPQKIKVKYSRPSKPILNGEIFAEVVATRLLWALGFGADRMFFVEKTHCFGCTADPFHDRRLDEQTVQQARVFTPTALEVKFDGIEIQYKGPQPKPQSQRQNYQPPERRVHPEGWDFNELMNLVEKKPKARKIQQKTERDALRLLGVFIGHEDTKPENQRLICMGEEVDGKCEGRTLLIYQDLGQSFGGLDWRKELKFVGISEVEIKRWAGRTVWKTPEQCVGRNSSLGLGGGLYYPTISEEGRQFLLKLLEGFSEGAAGRKRVEDLFKMSHIDLKDGTIEQWVNAFYAKIHEIKYPMGEGQPNFKCPKTRL